MSLKSFKLLSILIFTVFFLVYSGSLFCMATKTFAHCGRAHSDCDMVALQKAPKTIEAKITVPVPNILLAQIGSLYIFANESVFNCPEPFVPKYKDKIRINLPHAPPVS